jgi:cytochrome c biogenesis protein CcmG/thiol:disulfide interchange protein DsbE
VNGPISRAALLAGLAVVALAACGSDESDASTEPAGTESAGTESAGTESVSTAGSGSGDIAGPVSTVPADLPEQLVGQIGALDVAGEALPMFGGDTATDPAIGSAAPTMVGTDFAGNPVRVDAATDGPTMLVFLAHWCPHCNAEVPVLNGLRDAGRFPDDLNVIAVSTAVRPDRPNFPPSEWIDDVDWTYPVIADGVDMAAGTFLGPAAYGLDGFPFTVLIDADGNVAARWSGESTADEISANIATYLS